MPIPADQAQEGRAFYSVLFGREPQFEPHDDFFEWAPISGQECWFQVVAADTDPAPPTGRVRFRVDDIASAAAFLDHIGVRRTEPSMLPGVVAFLDFSDLWGNALGYYQDLAPAGEAATYPGTSVRDEALFRSSQVADGEVTDPS